MKTSEDSKRDLGEFYAPTTQSVYRAGIIGCGWIGLRAPDSHSEAYWLCNRVQLTAWCDPRLFFRTGCYYHNYVEMVREMNLDIVSVCTPVETHCKIVCDIAPYVKAIYCEKPMATTLKECDKMIEACEKHNTILQINHQRRFISPVFRFSRGPIETGTHVFDLLRRVFGPIQSVEKDMVWFKRGVSCQLEYIPTEEHIFELDCTRNTERMILKGVENLVFCLDYGIQSSSSGYEGREALKWALEFKDGLQHNP